MNDPLKVPTVSKEVDRLVWRRCRAAWKAGLQIVTRSKPVVARLRTARVTMPKPYTSNNRPLHRALPPLLIKP